MSVRIATMELGERPVPTEQLPDDAGAGGGLMVAVVQLAIALGDT